MKKKAIIKIMFNDFPILKKSEEIKILIAVVDLFISNAYLVMNNS